MNNWFLAAALASTVTFAVHTFAGGVAVARPLLASSALPPASKWLNYYCWHLVTLSLIGMALGFGWCARNADAADLALFLAVLAATSSALSIAVALKAGIGPWRFPSTTLFALIAVLAFAGLAPFRALA
jgi:hypothetical protein